MTFVHGKGAGVLVKEFDLSSDFTQYNFGFNVALANVTTFGNDDKVWLPGLNEGQMSPQGVWNPAADQSDEELVALDGTEVVVSASPQGFAAVGDRVHMVNGFLANYQPRAPHNDAVRFSSSIQGSEGAYLGVALKDLSQESSTGNFASVDQSAQTTDGATAFLHVTQFSGTNATVTIEDSANDSTFGSLVAFTAATGVTSEKVTVSGTVERYVRVALTGTFTNLTFVVSFKRHRK